MVMIITQIQKLENQNAIVWNAHMQLGIGMEMIE
jgi:hypothetical protein